MFQCLRLSAGLWVGTCLDPWGWPLDPLHRITALQFVGPYVVLCVEGEHGEEPEPSLALVSLAA